MHVRGLRVTSPTRTAVDGARLAPSLIEAVVFLDMMLASGVVDSREIGEGVEAGRGRRGIGQARRALSLADGASKSPMESRLRMVWVLDATLPRPLVNQLIFTLDGEPLGEPDLLDEESSTVGEYDGALHRALLQHSADNRREERFEDHGLVVVRVTAIDLAHKASLVARLRRGYERGRSRDRSKDRWTLDPPGWHVSGTSRTRF